MPAPRVVAGSARGRRLEVPPRGVRPTGQRVREALASALESARRARGLDGLVGARVLDLWAGSGALGLELLSRGAAAALLVERDRRTAAVAAANVRATGLAGARVLVGDARRPDVAVPGEGPFDVVVADPPYATSEADVRAALDALVGAGWLADEVDVVVERSSRSPRTTWPDGWHDAGSRTYGEARLDRAEVGPALP